jgi:hypothetical protein
VRSSGPTRASAWSSRAAGQRAVDLVADPGEHLGAGERCAMRHHGTDHARPRGPGERVRATERAGGTGEPRTELGIERAGHHRTRAARRVRQVGRHDHRAPARRTGIAGHRDVGVEPDQHARAVLGVARRRGRARDHRAERLAEHRADPGFVQARHAPAA